MAGLPKFVLDRLRQKSSGPGLAGGPTPSESTSGATHPDANLLTAFLEQKLSERERELLLSHLAECGECREQVALALPPEVQETQAVRTAKRAPVWLSWPSLRWGAVAAALGTVLVAVFLHHPATQSWREKAMSENQRAPIPAQAGDKERERTPVQSADRLESKPSQARQPETARMSGRRQEPGGSLGATPEALSQSQNRAHSEDRPAGVPVAPPRRGDDSSQSSQVSREAASTNTISTPPSTAQLPAASVLGPSKTMMRESRTELAGGDVESTAAAPHKKPEAMAAPEAGILAGPSGAAVQGVAPRAPRASGRAAARFDTQQLKAKTDVLSAHWNISPSGKLERSVDGGRTWQELRVNDSIIFRVVTAIGREVWAGGSRGALYHSTDGGESWQRAILSREAIAPSDAIVGIRFLNPQHGTIITATGERWKTSDGGAHWERQSE